MRAGVDAVAVGIGTVLADDPALTVRDWAQPRVAPHRVVFDNGLRIPLDSTLVRTARDIDTRVIAATSGAPSNKINALIAAGVRVAMFPALRRAAHRGLVPRRIARRPPRYLSVTARARGTGAESVCLCATELRVVASRSARRRAAANRR